MVVSRGCCCFFFVVKSISVGYRPPPSPPSPLVSVTVGWMCGEETLCQAIDSFGSSSTLAPEEEILTKLPTGTEAHPSSVGATASVEGKEDGVVRLIDEVSTNWTAVTQASIRARQEEASTASSSASSTYSSSPLYSRSRRSYRSSSRRSLSYYFFCLLLLPLLLLLLLAASS